jgi:hypothetical protein
MNNQGKAECIFPFKIDRVLYGACTTAIKTEPWCPTKVDNIGRPFGDDEGFWGYCEKEDPLDISGNFIEYLTGPILSKIQIQISDFMNRGAGG